MGVFLGPEEMPDGCLQVLEYMDPAFLERTRFRIGLKFGGPGFAVRIVQGELWLRSNELDRLDRPQVRQWRFLGFGLKVPIVLPWNALPCADDGRGCMSGVNLFETILRFEDPRDLLVAYVGQCEECKAVYWAFGFTMEWPVRRNGWRRSD